MVKYRYKRTTADLALKCVTKNKRSSEIMKLQKTFIRLKTLIKKRVGGGEVQSTNRLVYLNKGMRPTIIIHCNNNNNSSNIDDKKSR